MKLTSASFLDNQRIPEEFAFGAHDPVLHVRLAGNRNPHLKWTGAPAATKSFALICVDPDAPTKPDDVNKEGRVVPASLPRAKFYHWVKIDIPPNVTEIGAGECSQGVVAGGKKDLKGPPGSRQGVNDYTGWFANDPDMAGTYRGYDGPCPPWNDMLAHRYQFTVYALSCERLNVEGDFTAPQVLDAMQRYVLDEATITGTYAINPGVK
ncbi:MAG TPA: YbhB/YbcL family Raf kinase inhibitor-like protein [Steroidobacteraceae bacterium]